MKNDGHEGEIDDAYKRSGPDYDAMDPFKRECQLAAQETNGNVESLGIKVLEWTRGESAFVYRLPTGHCIAHTQEGLGTKNIVADAMGDLFYEAMGEDTAAMILNDIITVGAKPVTLAMHLAVADKEWFENEVRARALVRGFKRACDLSGCTWGGGETAILKGIIQPGTAELSGSATGFVESEAHLINATKNVVPGLAIMLFGSTGLHSNGSTLARQIAGELPEGYRTKIPGGGTYGEALLKPTRLYVKLMRTLQGLGIDIKAAINITGHGWRKLMRPLKPITYVIERIPEPQPVFRFMQAHRRISDRGMYNDFNMNAGFAALVDERDVGQVLAAAEALAIPALRAGYTDAGPRQVIIKPKENLTFDASTLKIS